MKTIPSHGSSRPSHGHERSLAPHNPSAALEHGRQSICRRWTGGPDSQIPSLMEKIWENSIGFWLKHKRDWIGILASRVVPITFFGLNGGCVSGISWASLGFEQELQIAQKIPEIPKEVLLPLGLFIDIYTTILLVGRSLVTQKELLLFDGIFHGSYNQHEVGVVGASAPLIPNICVIIFHQVHPRCNMTGWWLSLPLWRIWVRQLGLLFPI